uniref:SPK domain-containing protein n=1 Tax=Caenorhabditis tropicalis TaxID=1561998 RepID=A0A1I7T5R4_9PELO
MISLQFKTSVRIDEKKLLHQAYRTYSLLLVTELKDIRINSLEKFLKEIQSKRSYLTEDLINKHILPLCHGEVGQHRIEMFLYHLGFKDEAKILFRMKYDGKQPDVFLRLFICENVVKALNVTDISRYITTCSWEPTVTDNGKFWYILDIKDKILKATVVNSEVQLEQVLPTKEIQSLPEDCKKVIGVFEILQAAYNSSTDPTCWNCFPDQVNFLCTINITLMEGIGLERNLPTQQQTTRKMTVPITKFDSDQPSTSAAFDNTEVDLSIVDPNARTTSHLVTVTGKRGSKRRKISNQPNQLLSVASLGNTEANGSIIDPDIPTTSNLNTVAAKAFERPRRTCKAPTPYEPSPELGRNKVELTMKISKINQLPTTGPIRSSLKTVQKPKIAEQVSCRKARISQTKKKTSQKVTERSIVSLLTETQNAPDEDVQLNSESNQNPIPASPSSENIVDKITHVPEETEHPEFEESMDDQTDPTVDESNESAMNETTKIAFETPKPIEEQGIQPGPEAFFPIERRSETDLYESVQEHLPNGSSDCVEVEDSSENSSFHVPDNETEFLENHAGDICDLDESMSKEDINEVIPDNNVKIELINAEMCKDANDSEKPIETDQIPTIPNQVDEAYENQALNNAEDTILLTPQKVTTPEQIEVDGDSSVNEPLTHHESSLNDSEKQNEEVHAHEGNATSFESSSNFEEVAKDSKEKEAIEDSSVDQQLACIGNRYEELVTDQAPEHIEVDGDLSVNELLTHHESSLNDSEKRNEEIHAHEENATFCESSSNLEGVAEDSEEKEAFEGDSGDHHIAGIGNMSEELVTDQVPEQIEEIEKHDSSDEFDELEESIIETPNEQMEEETPEDTGVITIPVENVDKIVSIGDDIMDIIPATDQTDEIKSNDDVTENTIEDTENEDVEMEMAGDLAIDDTKSEELIQNSNHDEIVDESFERDAHEENATYFESSSNFKEVAEYSEEKEAFKDYSGDHQFADIANMSEELVTDQAPEQIEEIKKRDSSDEFDELEESIIETPNEQMEEETSEDTGVITIPAENVDEISSIGDDIMNIIPATDQNDEVKSNDDVTENEDIEMEEAGDLAIDDTKSEELIQNSNHDEIVEESFENDGNIEMIENDTLDREEYEMNLEDDEMQVDSDQSTGTSEGPSLTTEENQSVETIVDHESAVEHNSERPEELIPNVLVSPLQLGHGEFSEKVPEVDPVSANSKSSNDNALNYDETVKNNLIQNHEQLPLTQSSEDFSNSIGNPMKLFHETSSAEDLISAEELNNFEQHDEIDSTNNDAIKEELDGYNESDTTNKNDQAETLRKTEDAENLVFKNKEAVQEPIVGETTENSSFDGLVPNKTVSENLHRTHERTEDLSAHITSDLVDQELSCKPEDNDDLYKNIDVEELAEHVFDDNKLCEPLEFNTAEEGTSDNTAEEPSIDKNSTEEPSTLNKESPEVRNDDANSISSNSNDTSPGEHQSNTENQKSVEEDIPADLENTRYSSSPIEIDDNGDSSEILEETHNDIDENNDSIEEKAESPNILNKDNDQIDDNHMEPLNNINAPEELRSPVKIEEPETSPSTSEIVEHFFSSPVNIPIAHQNKTLDTSEFIEEISNKEEDTEQVGSNLHDSIEENGDANEGEQEMTLETIKEGPHENEMDFVKESESAKKDENEIAGGETNEANDTPIFSERGTPETRCAQNIVESELNTTSAYDEERILRVEETLQQQPQVQDALWQNNEPTPSQNVDYRIDEDIPSQSHVNAQETEINNRAMSDNDEGETVQENDTDLSDIAPTPTSFPVYKNDVKDNPEEIQHKNMDRNDEQSPFRDLNNSDQPEISTIENVTSTEKQTGNSDVFEQQYAVEEKEEEGDNSNKISEFCMNQTERIKNPEMPSCSNGFSFSSVEEQNMPIFVNEKTPNTSEPSSHQNSQYSFHPVHPSWHAHDVPCSSSSAAPTTLTHDTTRTHSTASCSYEPVVAMNPIVGHSNLLTECEEVLLKMKENYRIVMEDLRVTKEGGENQSRTALRHQDGSNPFEMKLLPKRSSMDDWSLLKTDTDRLMNEFINDSKSSVKYSFTTYRINRITGSMVEKLCQMSSPEKEREKLEKEIDSTSSVMSGKFEGKIEFVLAPLIEKTEQCSEVKDLIGSVEIAFDTKKKYCDHQNVIQNEKDRTLKYLKERFEDVISLQKLREKRKSLDAEEAKAQNVSNQLEKQTVHSNSQKNRNAFSVSPLPIIGLHQNIAFRNEPQHFSVPQLFSNGSDEQSSSRSNPHMSSESVPSSHSVLRSDMVTPKSSENIQGTSCNVYPIGNHPTNNPVSSSTQFSSHDLNLLQQQQREVHNTRSHSQIPINTSISANATQPSQKPLSHFEGTSTTHHVPPPTQQGRVNRTHQQQYQQHAPPQYHQNQQFQQQHQQRHDQAAQERVNEEVLRQQRFMEQLRHMEYFGREGQQRQQALHHQQLRQQDFHHQQYQQHAQNTKCSTTNDGRARKTSTSTPATTETDNGEKRTGARARTKSEKQRKRQEKQTQQDLDHLQAQNTATTRGSSNTANLDNSNNEFALHQPVPALPQRAQPSHGMAFEMGHLTQAQMEFRMHQMREIHGMNPMPWTMAPSMNPIQFEANRMPAPQNAPNYIHGQGYGMQPINPPHQPDPFRNQPPNPWMFPCPLPTNQNQTHYHQLQHNNGQAQQMPIQHAATVPHPHPNQYMHNPQNVPMAPLPPRHPDLYHGGQQQPGPFWAPNIPNNEQRRQ